jgi:hypothetical protein
MRLFAMPFFLTWMMAFSLLKAHQPPQAYYFPFQDLQAWSGDTAAFAVADSALWLDAPSGGTWELSHPLQGGPDWQWHGLVQLDFNPSSVNCAWVEWSGPMNHSYRLIFGCLSDKIQVEAQSPHGSQWLMSSQPGWLNHSQNTIEWSLTLTGHAMTLNVNDGELILHQIVDVAWPVINQLTLGQRVTSTRVQAISWRPIHGQLAQAVRDSLSLRSFSWKWTEVMLKPLPAMHAQSPACDALEGFAGSSVGDSLWAAGWQLEVNGQPQPLPSRWLLPQHPIVIGDSACLLQAGVNSRWIWHQALSLPTQVHLLLKDHRGLTLAEIALSDDNHDPPDKAMGGWSLKARDSSCSCLPGSWTSATAAMGSDLGQFTQDALPPRQGGVHHVWTTDRLHIQWRHPMKSMQSMPYGWEAMASDHWTYSPFYPTLLGDLQTLLIPPSFMHCDGSALDTAVIAWGMAAMPDSGEVQLNEILFNPLPGGQRFVELRNLSSRVLDMGSLVLSDQWPPMAWRQLAPAGSFLLPDETRAFVMSPPALVNDYPMGDSTFIATAASLPPLDDDHGELLLLTSHGQRLDQAFYDDALHHPSLGQGEGIAILKQVDHWISAGADSATPGRSPPLVHAPLMGLMDIQQRHFGWLSGQRPRLSFALRAEGPWVIQEALFSIDGTWTITWSDPLPVQSIDHWTCHVLPPQSARGAALWVLQWTASTGRVVRRSFPIIID